MKSLTECSFLLLCGCVLALLLFVSDPVASQRIVESKYQLKTYRIGNSVLKGMIIETTFDTDLYKRRKVCDISGGPDPTFLRCCSSAQDSNCHRVPSGHVCLDNSGLYGLFSNESKPVTFDGMIANPNQCDVAVLTVEAVQGDPQVYFSFSDSILNPSAKSNHFVSAFPGTDWLEFCCASEFQRALANAGSRDLWNGRVIGTIIPVGTFAVSNVFIDTTPKLNMTRYWREIAPSLVVPQPAGPPRLAIPASTCINDIICGLLAPTDDPVGSDFRVQSPYPPVFRYKPRTHAFALIDSIVAPGGPDGTQSFTLVSESFIANRQVALQYDLLETLQSDPVQNVIIPSRFRPQCSSAAFSEVATQLRGAIQGISDAETVPSLRNFGFTLQQTASYVLSDAWVACETYARSELLTARNQTLTKNSFACLFAPGTPQYRASPCCNASLAVTQCCAPQEVSYLAQAYAPNVARLESSCSFSRCGVISAQDYAALVEQDVLLDGCGDDLVKTSNQLDEQIDLVPRCFVQTFGQTCAKDSDCGASSWCDARGICAAPCTSSSACASGSCVSGLCAFVNQSDAQSRRQSSFLDCLLNSTNDNELFEATLRAASDVSDTASKAEFNSAFWNTISTTKCVGAFSSDEFDTRSSCETSVCNWASCSPDSSPTCTQQNCVTNAPSVDFCGECHGSLCVEQSEFGGCYAPGGAYNCSILFPGSSTVWPSGNCKLPSSFDGDSCYLPQFCPNATVCSAPYCYNPAITSASNCNSSTLEWRTWTLSNGSDVSICVRKDATSFIRCAIDLRLQWWPGVSYRPPKHNDSSSCVGFCSGRPDLNTEPSCNAASYCAGFPAISSSSACSSAGTCDDASLVGCVLPYNQQLINCIQVGNYLCVNSSWSQPECAAAGGIYRPARATDAASCNIAVCAQPNPLINSFMTPTQCSACGGTFVAALSWQPAKWTPAHWVPYSWIPRAFVVPNRWVSAPDTKKLSVLHEATLASALTEAYQSELYCRYDRSASALTALSCNCGDIKNTTGSCLIADVSRPIVSVAQMCGGVDLRATTPLASVFVPAAGTGSFSTCTEVIFRSIPQAQFKERSQISLTSSFLSRGQASRITSARFLKNDNQVVVGEVVGDGVGVSFEVFPTSPALVCLTINQGALTNTTSGLAFSFFTVAQMNAGFTAISLVAGAPAVSLTATSVCVNISGSAVLFPIAVAADYSKTTFYQSLPDGERAVVIIAALIYSALTVVNCYHLLMHLTTHRGTFLTLPKTALTALIVFLVFRVVYFLCWPNGITERYPAVGVLFGEFPPIVFLVVYSVIVARWAQIYHYTMSSRGSGSEFGKLQPILFGTDAVLVVAFIVLVILFFTLPASLPQVTCATTPAELNARAPAEIVAIVYKFFYAAVSLVMSGLFSLYGVRITNVVRNSDKLQGKGSQATSNKKLLRLVVVTFVCTFALVAQVINLIHSSFTSDRNIYGVLAALLLIEVIPCIIFLDLFKVRSDFIQRVKEKLRTTFGGSRTLSTGNFNSAALSRTDSIRDNKSRIKK